MLECSAGASKIMQQSKIPPGYIGVFWYQSILRAAFAGIRANASRKSIVQLLKGAKTTVWHRLSVLPPDGRREAAPYRASTQTAIRGCASPRAAWRGGG